MSGSGGSTCAAGRLGKGRPINRSVPTRGAPDFSSRAARGESWLFHPTAGGELSVCLIYPNVYSVAMANLGYQAVYRILAEHPRIGCDRAYLQQGVPRRLVSFEGHRPLSDFDVLAFSISCEADYVNVLSILAAAGLPLRGEERSRHGRMPLVVAGGPATFLNPEPLADFVDVFLIGEAEEMVSEFLDVLLGARDYSRRDLLEAVGGVAGAYVPEHYTPRYGADGRLVAFDHESRGPGRVRRRWLADLNQSATTSQILTSDAVFGGMFMVEGGRGCGWGCRFCAAGYVYRPVRYRSEACVRAGIAEGLKHRTTIGLVGPEMGSLPGVASTCEHVVASGGRPSPSSLKADVISERLARALAAGGNRSVTLAPEAGSERMRRVINKNLTEGEIMRAVRWLVSEGVDRLKLYFMIGLPTERDDDVEAIVDLVERMRVVPRIGRRIRSLTVSVNSFVPKPSTPLQWEPMESLGTLQQKLARLRRRLASLPNVVVEAQSPREAYYQTALSRGDRRVGIILEAIHRRRGAWWAVLQEFRHAGGASRCVPSPDFYVHRAYDPGEMVPWGFIDHGIDTRFLLAERRKAFAGFETPPCDVATCRSCRLC